MEFLDSKIYPFLLDGAPPELTEQDKATINACVGRLDSLLKAAEDSRESSAAERMAQAVRDFTQKPSKAAVELVRTCALETVTGNQVADALRNACNEVAVIEGRKLFAIVERGLNVLLENMEAGVRDYRAAVEEKGRAIGMQLDSKELEGRLRRSQEGYVDRIQKLERDPARAFQELEALGYAENPFNNYVV